MGKQVILVAALVLAGQSAPAAPALYNCEFKTVSDRKAAAQPNVKPLVKSYIFDPATGAGVIEGSDLEVLVVSGADAISFVTRAADGSVDSTTIWKKGAVDNKFPAVFSSHHIGPAFEPKQWYGSCVLSQRG